MIRVKVHLDDQCRPHEPTPVDQLGEILASPRHGTIWVDVSDPTEADFAILTSEFGFHPLAIEDAVKQHQRPKIDFYEGYLFITFYVLRRFESEIRPVELDMFVGKDYLVTLHDGDCPEVDRTADRWCTNGAHLAKRGAGFLVYALLDAVVDGYFPAMDALTEKIENIEERIFEHFDRGVQRDIFSLRREMIAIRKVLSPERDVMNVLVRRDTPVLGDELIVYFQDVYDHILRVNDSLETFREVVSSSLDASLSVTSNRMNQVMKTLTASSIILMSMTLVASVYGMNFDHMPELDWLLGYPMALGLMVLIGVSLLAIFRRIHWF